LSLTSAPTLDTIDRTRTEGAVMMRCEILSIEDCPNGADAVCRFEEALAAEGHEAEVEHRVMRTAEDAAGTAFAGSPTMTVNGQDLFPSAVPVDGLACRIYVTASGLAGLPTIDQIRAAIADRGR
jgi:hypothetical protein